MADTAVGPSPNAGSKTRGAIDCLARMNLQSNGFPHKAAEFCYNIQKF